MLSMKARIISRSGRALSETEKSCPLGSEMQQSGKWTMGKHERHEKVLENMDSGIVMELLALTGMVG